jgi:hypothetical protein
MRVDESRDAEAPLGRDDSGWRGLVAQRAPDGGGGGDCRGFVLCGRAYHRYLQQRLRARNIDYTALCRRLRRLQPPSGRYESLKKQLDPDALLRAARQQAGLDDFGGEAFIEPHRRLLDCAARDVDFSDEGLQHFRYHVVRCLVNRLRIREDFRRHPEILDEDVSDPIVVIGLPRSGTTKMQRILSSLPDTDIQKPYLWQMMNPAPFPDAPPGRPDPRIAVAGRGGLSTDGRPEFEAAHLIAAEEPEEDGLMCDSTFDDWVWSSIFAPSLDYYEWVIQRPHLDNYRHLRTMYQYLQWQNGGRRNRRWVTKNVQHIAYLGELLQCFPNATLIHCHRTPRDSIPSLAKLTLEIWSAVVKEVNPVFAGQAMFGWWQAATERYLAARDALHLDDRIIDIPYERIRRDAVRVAQEIYAGAGRPLTPAQLHCVMRWERDNEQYKHGRNMYSLEQFGLSEAQIDRGFADYIRRFIG